MVLTSFGVRLKIDNKGVRGIKDDCQVSELSNWWYYDYLASMIYLKKYKNFKEHETQDKLKCMNVLENFLFYIVNLYLVFNIEK